MSHGCLLACQDFLQPFDMLPFTSETKLARHFHASRFSTVLSRTSYTGFYRPTVLQEVVRCSGDFPWQMTHYSPVLETGNSKAVVFISRFMHTEKGIPDCRSPNFDDLAIRFLALCWKEISKSFVGNYSRFAHSTKKRPFNGDVSNYEQLRHLYACFWLSRRMESFWKSSNIRSDAILTSIGRL